jgi:hypothetical protein
MSKRAGWLLVSKKLPTKVSSKSGRNPDSVPARTHAANGTAIEFLFKSSVE